jgi:hypothetical protein
MLYVASVYQLRATDSGLDNGTPPTLPYLHNRTALLLPLFTLAHDDGALELWLPWNAIIAGW